MGLIHYFIAKSIGPVLFGRLWCGWACRTAKMCPMDVRIPEYIKDGQRVLSTEYSLCKTCLTVCARDALKPSFGFDLGGKELLRERECKTAPATVAKSATK